MLNQGDLFDMRQVMPLRSIRCGYWLRSRLVADYLVGSSFEAGIMEPEASRGKPGWANYKHAAQGFLVRFRLKWLGSESSIEVTRNAQ
jgi:hypothetical protein